MKLFRNERIRHCKKRKIEHVSSRSRSQMTQSQKASRCFVGSSSSADKTVSHVSIASIRSLVRDAGVCAAGAVACSSVVVRESASSLRFLRPCLRRESIFRRTTIFFSQLRNSGALFPSNEENFSATRAAASFSTSSSVSDREGLGLCEGSRRYFLMCGSDFEISVSSACDSFARALASKESSSARTSGDSI